MYSLGEIEAQCKKAAKGVGLSWGLAEETGLIARHLSELGLPGSDAIYLSLKFIDDNGLEHPSIYEGSFDEIGKPKTGLLLGVFFLDCLSDVLEINIKIKDPVIGPLSVVGALLRLQNEHYSFSVSWDNCQITMNEDGFNVSGKNINPKSVGSLVVSISGSSKEPFFLKRSIERSSIDSWDFLTKMAHKTYVPESPMSRLLGAGADDNENE